MSDFDSSDNKNLAGLFSAAAVALFLTSTTKSKRRKRCWALHWRYERELKGCFHTIENEFKLKDPDSFKNFIRMDYNLFEKLLSYIKEDIRCKDSCMRKAISPEEKLAITLRFLATGESFKSLNFNSRISCSYLSKWIPVICEVIYRKLKDNYLKFPNSKEEWMKISERFTLKWQFPHCLGALDGKHINFQARRSDGAYYRNYKGFDSIVLLALVDADCKFVYIDVGCNGRVSDGGVFRRSKLFEILEKYENLPPDEIIGNNRNLPYVVVADDAFALQKHLMKPFPYKTNNVLKKIFNIRLTTARQNVERAFGILASRFRILQTKINLKVESVEKVVMACCAIHNFLIDNDPKYGEEIQIQDEVEEVFHVHREIDKDISANQIRNEFADYFINEGKVNWQLKKISH